MLSSWQMLRRYGVRRWLGEYWPDTLLVAIVAAVVAGLVAYAIIDHTDREECTSSGGHVEEYNRRTIMVTQSCGSGCFITVPIEISAWRCIYAEKP